MRSTSLLDADAAQLLEPPQIDEARLRHRAELQADVDVGAAGDRRQRGSLASSDNAAFSERGRSSDQRASERLARLRLSCEAVFKAASTDRKIAG